MINVDSTYTAQLTITQQILQQLLPGRSSDEVLD